MDEHQTLDPSSGLDLRVVNSCWAPHTGHEAYLKKNLLPIKISSGAPGWLSQVSIQLLVSAQVMISPFREFEPHIRLCADSAEPAWGSLSPFFSASRSPHQAFSQNKYTLNYKKMFIDLVW